MPSTAAATDQHYAELAARFHEEGYLHLPQVISAAELDALRHDSGVVIDRGWRGAEPESDYFHDPDPESGADVFHRVQYIFPKAARSSFLTLLGNPFLLGLVEHLIGADFICEAEALVFKAPRNGREVPVHTDGDSTDARLGPLIFNVDYYLDDSTIDNGCLYIAPGSHKRSLSGAEIAAHGFAFPGLAPLPARAGDVVIHNIRTVHGSRRSSGAALRRVLYYEFQSLRQITAQGGIRPGYPVTERWIADRLRLLTHAIDLRAASDYDVQEAQFPYRFDARYLAKWPEPNGGDVNLRPALGYNKYF